VRGCGGVVCSGMVWLGVMMLRGLDMVVCLTCMLLVFLWYKYILILCCSVGCCSLFTHMLDE
jgi:hypothetical protein